jgi:hypothetical protein
LTRWFDARNANPGHPHDNPAVRLPKLGLIQFSGNTRFGLDAQHRSIGRTNDARTIVSLAIHRRADDNGIANSDH